MAGPHVVVMCQSSKLLGLVLPLLLQTRFCYLGHPIPTWTSVIFVFFFPQIMNSESAPVQAIRLAASSRSSSAPSSSAASAQLPSSTSTARSGLPGCLCGTRWCPTTRQRPHCPIPRKMPSRSSQPQQWWRRRGRETAGLRACRLLEGREAQGAALRLAAAAAASCWSARAYLAP